MSVICPYCEKEYKNPSSLNTHIRAFHTLPPWLKEGVYVYVRKLGEVGGEDEEDAEKRLPVRRCLYIETLTSSIIQYREVGIGELMRLSIKDFIHEYCGPLKSANVLRHVEVHLGYAATANSLVGLAFCYANKWFTSICGITGDCAGMFATINETDIVGFITQKGNVKYMQVKEFIKFASGGDGKTLFFFRDVKE